MHILVRMPNWLGDIVMATPVIKMVRERYPEAHIAASLPEAVAPLIAEDPHLDEVIGFTSKGRAYDLGILLTNSFSSAYRMWRAGVKRRLGYKRDGRGILLTDPVPFVKKRQHLVKTYQELLGGDGSLCPTLYLQDEEKEWAQEYLKELRVEGRMIGIHATAAFGPAKCWPSHKFRLLAEILGQRNTVLFFGDRASEGAISRITEGIKGRVINLAGKTNIRQLMALIHACDIIVSNDSGPMHIADALEVPLVALFGSTDPRLTGPYRSKGVLWKQVSCSPCFKRSCPTDFRCMRSISLSEVLQRIDDVV